MRPGPFPVIEKKVKELPDEVSSIPGNVVFLDVANGADPPRGWYWLNCTTTDPAGAWEQLEKGTS